MADQTKPISAADKQDAALVACAAQAKAEMRKIFQQIGPAYNGWGLKAQETAYGVLVGNIGLDRFRACMAKPPSK